MTTHGTTASSKKSKGFTAEEKAAMRERSRELKAAARAEKDRAAGEREVLAKIAEMQAADRAIAERLHEIVTASAPSLSPRTWYGMPAYASEDGVVCHFRPAEKFKTRYPTFGFSDKADLDDGALWPVEFALRELTAGVEAAIGTLVERAVR